MAISLKIFFYKFKNFFHSHYRMKFDAVKRIRFSKISIFINKKAVSCKTASKNPVSGDSRSRTDDPLLAKQML